MHSPTWDSNVLFPNYFGENLIVLYTSSLPILPCRQRAMVWVGLLVVSLSLSICGALNGTTWAISTKVGSLWQAPDMHWTWSQQAKGLVGFRMGGRCTVGVHVSMTAPFCTCLNLCCMLVVVGMAICRWRWLSYTREQKENDSRHSAYWWSK